MKKEHISFHDQIARNKRNSIFLMAIIIAVLVLLGYVVALVFQLDVFSVLIVMIIFSLLYTWLTYYYSDKIALAAVRAKPADSAKHRQLYNSVEGLTLASGLPMPKLYIMENSEINAFATGRNPQNSVVCVTTGALEKLNKQELEGVLAHELSHIANYDIRFITLVVVMVGVISIMSEIFLRSLYYRGGDREGKANAVILAIGVLLAILAPIAVRLVQFAISRKREYSADAGAVKLTRYPSGLIGALKKIKKNAEMKVPKATAPLFIANPFKGIGKLFSTHPPIDERIRILESM